MENVMGSAYPFGSGKHADSASFDWFEQTEGMNTASVSTICRAHSHHESNRLHV
jgi:tetrahydromethanopterin S-methyltransferase subunit H